MAKDLNIYVNRLHYDYLANSGHYSDRGEFYRTHEKSLWTIKQLIKLGHEITLTDKAGQHEITFTSQQELTRWIQKTYPEFVDQLEKPLYSKYGHPNDYLKK
jgi:hypothetical protein